MSLFNATIMYPQIDGALQIEQKNADYGLIDGFRESSKNFAALTPSLKRAIETNYNRQTYLKGIKDSTIPTTTAKSWVIPTNFSETEKILVTYVTMFAGIHMADEMFFENHITKEEYISVKLKEIGKAFAVQTEAYLYTALNTYKTQVLPKNSLSGKGFAFTTALGLTEAAQQNRALNLIESIMRQNGLTKPKLMMSTYGIDYMLEYYAARGMSNTVDLQNQTNIGVYKTNGISDSGLWRAFLVENGAVAMVNNFQPSFVTGDQISEQSKIGITPYMLPFLNEKVEFIYKKGEIDLSAINSDYARTTVAYGEQLGLAHSFAILRPYNSNIASNVNPIVEVIGATS